ncbi:MAG: molybdopterin-dependent oxidoreductase, partial [Nitrososphaerota archaeon]
MSEVKTLCGMCLPSGRGLCGVKAIVSNDRLIRIEGDREHPNNRGVLCAKGLATVQLVYHPDRLKHPLKRVGERGSGKFKEISWTEALDTIASKMMEAKRKYGAEAVAFFRGTQGWWNLTYTDFYRLAKLFGTPNDGSIDYICHWPRAAGSRLTYGAFPTPDYRRAECIVVWGAHPPYSNAPEQNPSFVEAMKRARKTIVIDPRPTFLALRADIWLRVRPGTDGALALGFIHVIIEEGLYDRQFVEEWTVGFEDLKRLVKKYPPDKVAEVTWVPKDQIVDAARSYATIKPGCILFGNGLDQHSNTFQTIRAICILRSIVG